MTKWISFSAGSKNSILFFLMMLLKNELHWLIQNTSSLILIVSMGTFQVRTKGESLNFLDSNSILYIELFYIFYFCRLDLAQILSILFLTLLIPIFFRFEYLNGLSTTLYILLYVINRKKKVKLRYIWKNENKTRSFWQTDYSFDTRRGVWKIPFLVSKD